MAILTSKNIPGTKPTQSHQYRTQEELGTSIKYNKEKSTEALMQYVDGISVSVTYFNQIMGVNSVPTLPDIGITVGNINYNRVNSVELKLTTPIPSGLVGDVTGETTFNIGVIPNYGDVFIMDLSGGRSGIFVITEVSKKSYNNNDAYVLSFKLMDFADTNAALYNDLVYKTSRQFRFTPNNDGGVISLEDSLTTLSLKSLISELLVSYPDEFISKETNMLRLSYNNSEFIDPDFIKFVKMVIPTSTQEGFGMLATPNVELKPNSVWDLIIKRRVTLLSRINRNLDYVNVGLLANNSGLLRSLICLGVKYIISDTTGVTGSVSPTLPDLNWDGAVTNISDGTYVFSDSFYDNDKAGCNDMEFLLLQYMNNEILDQSKLRNLCSVIYGFRDKERYYYIPLLVMLINKAADESWVSL